MAPKKRARHTAQAPQNEPAVFIKPEPGPASRPITCNPEPVIAGPSSKRKAVEEEMEDGSDSSTSNNGFPLRRIIRRTAKKPPRTEHEVRLTSVEKLETLEKSLTTLIDYLPEELDAFATRQDVEAVGDETREMAEKFEEVEDKVEEKGQEVLECIHSLEHRIYALEESLADQMDHFEKTLVHISKQIVSVFDLVRTVVARSGCAQPSHDKFCQCDYVSTLGAEETVQV